MIAYQELKCIFNGEVYSLVINDTGHLLLNDSSIQTIVANNSTINTSSVNVHSSSITIDDGALKLTNTNITTAWQWPQHIALSSLYAGYMSSAEGDVGSNITVNMVNVNTIKLTDADSSKITPAAIQNIKDDRESGVLVMPTVNASIWYVLWMSCNGYQNCVGWIDRNKGNCPDTAINITLYGLNKDGDNYWNAPVYCRYASPIIYPDGGTHPLVASDYRGAVMVKIIFTEER